jgi:hypothetical protein
MVCFPLRFSLYLFERCAVASSEFGSLLPTTNRVEGLESRRRVAFAVCVALLDIEPRCGGKILCNQTPDLDNEYRVRSRKLALDCLSEYHHDIP